MIDHIKVNRGQQIDLKGEVTRIDEDTVTIDLGPLVTVDRDKREISAAKTTKGTCRCPGLEPTTSPQAIRAGRMTGR
ncbi:hypothetical protein [Mesorhizobium sp. M1295]|uniref:hypothetical protein n=1 Tax=Mesorhizobium sp. M1295 TaxID=2957076 RepID=UPI0033372961